MRRSGENKMRNEVNAALGVLATEYQQRGKRKQDELRRLRTACSVPTGCKPYVKHSGGTLLEVMAGKFA